MDKKTIVNIFLTNNLEKTIKISKINIGYSNEVYSINDQYILKVYEDVKNEINLKKEIFFYDFFKNQIPVPKVVLFDNSKKLCNKIFMIYKKIHGVNLYSIWHLLNDDDRKNIIDQLCNILRIINESSTDKYIKQFNLNSSVNWHDEVLNNIDKSLLIMKNKNIISEKFIQKIKEFVTANHYVLNEQKIALVYWDAHFDNILIKNNVIVGILDFERTKLSSIDYNLDIVKRMVDYPKKYMSEQFEKYAKKEDYSQLLIWFHEFYPELFRFKNLYKRLNIYSLEHDLDTLVYWPNSIETKQMIAKVVDYKDLLS